MLPWARRFSSLGEHAAVWLALGAVGAAVDGPRRGAWLRGAAAVALSYVIGTAIKWTIRRRRPEIEGLPQLVRTPTQLSFPSSHATSSFAAARVYSALLPAAPLHVVAVLMAASRLYLGVHYPSDIAVGAALGTAIGSAARRAGERAGASAAR